MSAFADTVWATLPATGVRIMLLLLVVTLVDLLLLRRSASAAARHLVWTIATAAALMMPLLSTVLPAWTVPMPLAAGGIVPSAAPAIHAPADLHPDAGSPVIAERASMASSQVARASTSELPINELPTSATPSAITLTPSAGASAAATPRWWMPDVMLPVALVMAWLAGVVLLLARIAVEHMMVRRLARGATEERGAEWTALLARCAARQGVTRRVTLLRGDRTSVPLMWGIVRPRVLLPAGADGWPPARREAVLLHELAHVARHDCLTGLVAAVACALYWPAPLVWWAAHRLRTERELACDDAVLVRGMSAREYASQLLAIARSGTAPRSGMLALSMAAPSQLESRMRAALDRTRRRAASGPREWVAATLLVFATAAPLAAAVPSLSGTATASEPSPTRTAPVPDTLTTSATAPAQPPVFLKGGSWFMRRASPSEAIDGAPSMHVMLNTNGLNTFVVALSRLDGLTPEAIAGTGAPVRFRLKQDAGTLAFDGTFTAGEGRGRFTFTPDSAFADELVRRGMARPTLAALFTLGIHGVGLPLLDALAAEGYRTPTTPELTSVALTGVDAARVREMAALGYRLGAVRSLVSLHNNGIDPVFIRRANASAGRTLTIAELQAVRSGRKIVLRVDSARRPGGAPPAVVPPEPLPPTSAAATASSTLSADIEGTPSSGRWTLVTTRGGGMQVELFWTDGTNWRRDITLAELRELSPSALAGSSSTPVTFHTISDAGRLEFTGTVAGGRGSGDFTFRVNRGFIGTMRALGVQDIGEVRDHDLKNLTYGGITAGTIRELQRLGYARIGYDELLHFAIRLATPQYAEGLRAARVQGSESVEGVADLKHLGVSSFAALDFARSGYPGLSGDDLRDMARAGVTPEFVRILKAGGITGLSVDELIARRQGASRR